MKTRLLIRPNSDIRILDTEYTEVALVGLRVDNINNYDVQVGDVLAIRFDNPTLTPTYEGSWEVVAISPTYSCCLTDPQNTIVIALPWANSTGLNPGWGRNIVRPASGGLLSSAGYGFQGTGFNGLTPYMQSIDELSDGTLIVGGIFTTYNGVSANRIVGLNQDGTINTSFNYGTGFTGGGLGVVNVTVDSQDRIYVGGGFTNYNGTAINNIVRLTATGSIDTSFNVGTGFLGGTVYVYSIILDEPNGHIYVGGQFSQYNGTPANRIIRLLEDGSIDPTFNYGTGFSPSIGVRKMYLDTANDKLYVGGGFTSYNGTPSNRIIRLNLDGSIDSTFNIGTGFNSGEIFDILAYGGRVYVVGSFTQYNGSTANRIVRLNLDGSRDTLFNTGAGFNAVVYGIINHQGFLYVFGQFTSYNGYSTSKIAVLDYFGNINTNYQGQFNSGSFVFVMYPLGNDLLIGGSFTSYNGVTINRISIFRSLLRSVRYETKELNLKEDLQFPLTFNIADIREPQNRKSDYSKSITLPGTDNNGQILAQLFEIGADSTFNVNQKKDVFVIQDGLEIFSGYMKLENINREGWNDISYDIKIFGKISDLFSRLKTQTGADLRLSDLDFSEWDHNLNRSAIVNSWIGDIIRNGVDYSNVNIGPSYSVTDTGFNAGRTEFLFGSTHSLQVGDIVRFEMDFPDDATVNFNESNGFHTILATSSNSVTVNLSFRSGATNSGILTKYSSKGEGYVYPCVNLNGLDNKFNKNDIKIGIFAKNILDKIFDYVNLDYDSDFANEEYFKRLIVLGNNIQSSNSTRNFWVNNSGTFSISDSTGQFSDPEYTVLQLGNIELDLYNNWTATYSYKNNNLTNLEQTFNIYLQGLTTISSPSYLSIIGYRSFNLDGTPNSDWSNGKGSTHDDSGNNIGLVFNICESQWNTDGLTQPSAYSIVNSSYNSSIRSLETYITTPTIVLKPGEEIRFVVNFANNTSASPEIIINKCDITSYDIKVSSMMPDMTARDFLTGIIGMHNLYVENERGSETNYILEPFPTYYTLTNGLDWTDKVDTSKEISISPVAPNMPKTLSWTYTEDSDFYNKDYKDNYVDVYGFYETTQTSEFNNNSTQTKITFAPTPLVDQSNYGVILPKIVKDNVNGKVDKFKPRILYWLGLRYSSNPNPIYLDYTDFTNGFPVYLNYPDISNGLNMYGYAGHFDNPLDPTVDLSFGYNQKYYYGGSYPFLITENTLYNRFYKQYVDEVTDRNSRYLTCYMNLNSYDITNLSFRRIYYINNNLYRLQSINDYDPLSGDTTKCVFIKVKQAPQSTLENGIDFTNPEIDIEISDQQVSNRSILSSNALYTDDYGVILPEDNNSITGDLPSISQDLNFNTDLYTAADIIGLGGDIIAVDSSSSFISRYSYDDCSLIATYSTPFVYTTLYTSSFDNSFICYDYPSTNINKYNQSGNLDSSFSLTVTDLISNIVELKSGNGYYLINGGATNSINGTTVPPQNIVKLTATGSIDPSFTWNGSGFELFALKNYFVTDDDSIIISASLLFGYTQSIYGTYSIPSRNIVVGTYSIFAVTATGSYSESFNNIQIYTPGTSTSSDIILIDDVNGKPYLTNLNISLTQSQLFNSQYLNTPIEISQSGSIIRSSNVPVNCDISKIGSYLYTSTDTVYTSSPRNMVIMNQNLQDIGISGPMEIQLIQNNISIGNSVVGIKSDGSRQIVKYSLLSPYQNSIFGSGDSEVNDSFSSQILNSISSFIENSSNSNIIQSSKSEILTSSGVSIINSNSTVIDSISNAVFINVDNKNINNNSNFFGRRYNNLTTLSNIRIIGNRNITSLGPNIIIEGNINQGRISITPTSNILALTTFVDDTAQFLTKYTVLFPASDDSAAVRLYVEESGSNLRLRCLDTLVAGTTYRWNYINLM